MVLCWTNGRPICLKRGLQQNGDRLGLQLWLACSTRHPLLDASRSKRDGPKNDDKGLDSEYLEAACRCDCTGSPAAGMGGGRANRSTAGFGRDHPVVQAIVEGLATCWQDASLGVDHPRRAAGPFAGGAPI